MVLFAIVGCIAACCCILGFIWGIARWTTRIDANTSATDKLTQIFEHFVERVGTTLEDHGTRITRLETRSEYYESGRVKSVTHVEHLPVPEE